MKRTTAYALSVGLLLGALCLSGCGHGAAQKEADEAARWKSGGPSKSYAQEVDAKRAAAGKTPSAPAGAPKPPAPQ